MSSVDRLHTIAEIRRVLIDDGADPANADAEARRIADSPDADAVAAWIAEHRPAPAQQATADRERLLDALAGGDLWQQ